MWNPDDTDTKSPDTDANNVGNPVFTTPTKHSTGQKANINFLDEHRRNKRNEEKRNKKKISPSENRGGCKPEGPYPSDDEDFNPPTAGIARV